MNLSVSEEKTVRKILNGWFPGTLVNVVHSFVENATMLAIRYPETEAAVWIPLYGSKSEIADGIAESVWQYRARFIEHEDLHKDNGDYDG